jgi:hypothetical protein
MRESRYQSKVLARLRDLFPGCMLLKNDSSYIQGIPDWTLLHGRYWAMLEIKVSATADVQPNQDYYVERLARLGYAAFIYPGNEVDVFNELQQAFSPAGLARVSESKQ